MEKSGQVDVGRLSERQRKIYAMREEGMTQAEIARALGCSKQNVHIILKTIEKNIQNDMGKSTEEALQAKKRKEGEKGANNIAYKKYKDADLSILSSRERETMEGKLEGKSYRQIADSLGISVSTVGVSLANARAKLGGEETYAQKNKEKYNASRRTQEHREKEKQWHKNYVERHPEHLDKLKKYNREYYLKNKEKILERAKKRREGIVSSERIRITADEYKDITSGALAFILTEDKEVELGDELTLAEYEGKQPTGRELEIIATYIKKDWPGLVGGYCIIGFLLWYKKID